jgi:hypothetical protein
MLLLVVATPPLGTPTTTPPVKETQSQKKFVVFNIKQQREVFLELSCKE